MKYIRKFSSLSNAKAATLDCPVMTEVNEGSTSKMIIIDLGEGKTCKLEGSSLDDLKPSVTISGTWNEKTNKDTKVKISGEVSLTGKVDCYSIEFLSGAHITIEAGARLRIWQGGIVNNDCSSVNYITVIHDGINESLGELLLYPSSSNKTVNIKEADTIYTGSNIWCRFSVNMDSVSSYKSSISGSIGYNK